MKAMTSFTVKSLRDSAARTVVTIAGVALAAALLVAVLSSYVSATDYLLRNEATANGTWMSQVVLPDDEKTREEIASAEDATDVETLATLQDVGFAGLSNEQRVTLGIYLPILTGTGSIEELCGVRVAEGRLPQNAAEIMLPSTWQRGSTIALGDTITLDVGTRRAVLAPGEQGSMSGGSFAIGDYDPEFEPKGYSIEDGSALNSTMGYLDSEADEGKFDEELTDVTERSYTVVGFAATDNWTLMTGAGPAALTADASATGDIQAFLELSGISTVKQVRERTAELFPDADVQTHINLLRYMGISDHGSIWQTFSSWSRGQRLRHRRPARLRQPSSQRLQGTRRIRLARTRHHPAHDGGFAFHAARHVHEGGGQSLGCGRFHDGLDGPHRRTHGHVIGHRGDRRRRLRPGVRRGKRDATGMGIRCSTYRTRPSDDGGKRPEQCGHSQFPRRR